MPKEKSLILWFLFFFLLSAILPVSGQTAHGLGLSQPIEREIKGGEKQFFAVQLAPNQTARIEIEQKGIDISLAAYQPNGEKFLETESPSGLYGQDLILVTAAEAGEYKIEVSPADPRTAAGRYVIKLTEIRPTVPDDHKINEAARQITKTATEADALRRRGTREGRRQAIEKWREVVSLSRQKRDKVWESVAVLTTGLIYEQLGQLQKALDFYSEGLRLTRELGLRQYEGTALNNLGAIHNLLGEREQSVFYYTQTLALRQETGDKRGEAITLNNLGLVYTHLGDFQKAEEMLQKSLFLRRELKDGRGEGTTLNNLGQVFERRGDAVRALEFYRQALELRRAAGDRQGEAISLRNVGRAEWLYGEKIRGFETLAAALELWKNIGDRGGEADAHYWLAAAERERRDLPAAVRHAQAGLALIEQIRGEIFSPELRTAYFSTVQQFYELYTDLLVSRFEATKSEADAALAFEMSERARARSLIDLLREARVDILRGVDADLGEHFQELQDALGGKFRQRAQMAAGKAAPEQIAKITEEINSLHTEIEDLQARIRRENPRYADLTLGPTVSTADLQTLLDDETVLLEYKFGEARSFLWMVTARKLRLFILPARSEIEQTARDFYAAVVARDQARTTELSGRLGRMLVSPVADEIGRRRLVVVAEGVLQYIPFSALAGGPVQNPPRKDQNASYERQAPALLVETNDVVFLPSAGVLAELRRAAGQRKTPAKTIAIFADPIFEAADPRLSGALKNANQSEKAKVGTRLRQSANAVGNLPRLLASRLEARNILSLVAKNQAAVKLDFEASRENASDESLADYRIVHFATHGLIDTARPELSGLVFSLYDEKGNPQDGFLPLSQIYNLSFESDLIVLSACQTALGKDVRGEGLIGLTRGFMYAGARRVIASLWKVDDAATAEFMKLFYQNLLQEKLSPSRALQQAKAGMRQIPRFRAPYYWAGFVLQGDWQD